MSIRPGCRPAFAFACLAFGVGGFAAAAEARQSDAQVRQAIVTQAIAKYSGNCPYPYNRMRNGRRCGGNSAYSRPGGAAPRCYPSDVGKAEIDAFRRR